MSFEMLLNPRKVEQNPLLLFLFSLLCGTLALFLSYRIFPEHASVVMITFTIIPLIPVIVKLFEHEELILERMNPMTKHKTSFISSVAKRYLQLAKIYWALFLGLVVAFSFWYTFLPDSSSQDLFSEQIDTLYEFSSANAIYSDRLVDSSLCDTTVLIAFESTLTDCKVLDLDKDRYHEYLIYENSSKPTQVYYTKTGAFDTYRSYVQNTVFKNNIKLLVFVLLTSFVLGAGALFTIAWNASVIGVFVGEFLNKMISLVGYLPWVKAPVYFVALPLSLLSIAFHGFLEFMAYFFAAFAGGMIGIAMIRHSYKDRRFFLVLLESLVIFVFCVGLVYLGAVVESFV